MRTRAVAPRPSGRHRSCIPARTVAPPLVRLSLPIVAAVTIAALGSVGASAASLGGLTTSDLGASSGTVAAHPSGLTAQWMPARSGSDWLLDGIVLGAVEPFTDGERLKLSILDASGAALCEVSVVHSGTSAISTILRSDIDADCGPAGISFSAIDRVAVSAGT